VNGILDTRSQRLVTGKRQNAHILSFKFISRGTAICLHLAGWEGAELSLGTLAVGSGGKLWGLSSSGLEDTLELLANVLDTLSAGARDGGNVTIVGVDADNIGSDSVRLQVGDDNVTGSTVLGAITA
jgi:hypothetical protein